MHARDAPIKSERDAARAKIAFLPRDRKTEGILAPLSIFDARISALNDLARWGVLRWGRRNQLADQVCRDMKVKMADLRVADRVAQRRKISRRRCSGDLSLTKPRVLVLNDPMRGVDLGAKAELYEAPVNLAASGVAILLLSTKLIELCLLRAIASQCSMTTRSAPSSNAMRSMNGPSSTPCSRTGRARWMRTRPRYELDHKPQIRVADSRCAGDLRGSECGRELPAFTDAGNWTEC